MSSACTACTSRRWDECARSAASARAFTSSHSSCFCCAARSETKPSRASAAKRSWLRSANSTLRRARSASSAERWTSVSKARSRSLRACCRSRACCARLERSASRVARRCIRLASTRAAAGPLEPARSVSSTKRIWPARTDSPSATRCAASRPAEGEASGTVGRVGTRKPGTRALRVTSANSANARRAKISATATPVTTPNETGRAMRMTPRKWSACACRAPCRKRGDGEAVIPRPAVWRSRSTWQASQPPICRRPLGAVCTFGCERNGPQ